MIAIAIAQRLDFNILFSIGFVVGICNTLVRFQRGETLGLPSRSWKRTGMTLASCILFAISAPAYASIGIVSGYIGGAVWVGLVIHEAL